jgi:hypothetical protein
MNVGSTPAFSHALSRLRPSKSVKTRSSAAGQENPDVAFWAQAFLASGRGSVPV